MLAAGTGAQASYLALLIGLPVLAPALRDELDLTLTQVGIVIAAPWVGPIATLLPWGLLADRAGERRVLAGGLAACALLTAVLATLPPFPAFVALAAAAGAVGASVNAASGRAVMSWFGEAERGLALGIRQTSTPLGGIVAALALPPVEDAAGVPAALALVAALVLAGAVVAAVVVRDVPASSGVAHAPHMFREGRLWRLCAASGLVVIAQTAFMGFLVLFLHDVRGFSTARAGAVLAVAQAIAVVLRIVLGRVSDTLRDRVLPFRLVALSTVAAFAVAIALFDAPSAALVPALVLAGSLSMAWNGLSFTAVAELAGRARSGAAIGLQQTVLSVVGGAVPAAFAATVAATSWRTAFALSALGPLAGWWLLRPLTGPRRRDLRPPQAEPPAA